MRIHAELIGRDNFRAAIARSRTRLERNVARGLYHGGLYLLAAAEVYVPVDTGNLRGSGFVRRTGVGSRTVVHVGYTAAYSIYVHEDMTKHHGQAYNTRYAYEIANRHQYTIVRNGVRISQTYHERRPEEKAKFLTDALHESWDEIVHVILTEVRR